MLKTELHPDSVETTIGRERQFRACAGRIIKLGGKLPVKLSRYYNVVTTQYGARWQLQSVVAVIF